MRSHWEDRDELDLDAPATITERDLRSLRRKAGFGVFAVLLSFISIAGLAWTLYAGPEGLEQVQGVKERILGQEESAPVAPVQAQSSGTDSLAPQPLAADSMTATGPMPAPPAANQGSASGN